MNTKLSIGKTVIRCREEDFGYYTIFDGTVSIQVNSTFYFILKCLSENLPLEKIISELLDKFDTQDIDESKIKSDIDCVIKFIEDRNWR